MGFTVKEHSYDVPDKYHFYVALVDLARRNGGTHGNIGVDFICDRVQCPMTRYRPENWQRNDSVSYSRICLSGNDLIFNGQFLKDGILVSDKVNFIYLSGESVSNLWNALPVNLKSCVMSVIAENKNAPDILTSQLQSDIYKVSVDASKEKIRSPYSEDFAGEVSWSKGFNFDKPVELSNGIKVTGIRTIDFKDCTLFGVVTSDKQHYLLHDLVHGRDCEAFGKAVKGNVDKILNHKMSATIRPVVQKKM